MEFVGVHGMNEQFHISNRLTLQNRKALGDQGEQACRMQDLVIEFKEALCLRGGLAIIPRRSAAKVS
jgi:hypothetical protein